MKGQYHEHQKKSISLRLEKTRPEFTKKKGSLATSMKLLRSALAVGFALTPFIGGREALAGNGIVRVDGATGVPQSYLQNGANTAEIFAERWVKY